LVWEARPLIFEEEEAFLRSGGGLEDDSAPLQIKIQILSNNINKLTGKVVFAHLLTLIGGPFHC